MNAWFHAQEHLDYGYATMLFSWVDAAQENYPCLPPYGANGSAHGWPCMHWQHLEVGFPLVGAAAGPLVQSVYQDAFNAFVTGNASAGLSVPELYRRQVEAGRPVAELPTGVVEDGRPYPQVYNNGTRTLGERVSCDVFVCLAWKHAGFWVTSAAP